jgi:hypothetical protein
LRCVSVTLRLPADLRVSLSSGVSSRLAVKSAPILTGRVGCGPLPEARVGVSSSGSPLAEVEVSDCSVSGPALFLRWP